MATFSILRFELFGAVSLPAAVNLITTLIAILPDAVVDIISEVTRHLQQLKFNARILGTGIEADTRTDIRTSLCYSIHKSGKTIFPARPLGNGEFSGLGKVGRLADVSAILFVVEPLSGIGCGW